SYVKFDPDQPAALSLLSPDGAPDGASVSSSARILSTSGRRMSIATDLTAPAGTPVKLEWSKYVILGEVLSEQEATPTMMLYIRHAFDKQKLAPIRKRWLNPE